MEEYLQYMKALRSQMNDVEDQAAMISAEEQTQLTNVNTLEKDIDSAKSEMRQVREDTEKMMKAKGEICSLILEKQKKNSSLESDILTLTQTRELIQQERIGLSSKLEEKRAYYGTLAEDMSARLQQQQEWISTRKIRRELKEQESVKDKIDGQRDISAGKAFVDDNLNDVAIEARKRLKTQLDSAKARLDEILLMKSKLLTDNNTMKQEIEDVKHRTYKHKSEVKAADITILEEEYDALMSDKAGETEYFQSLKKRFEKLKGICRVIKCACGEEYTVAVSNTKENGTSEGCETMLKCS